MAQRQPIPTFYLYGEPHRTVGDGFLHVEALDDRSRPSEWTIEPHAHAELCHVFLIVAGGGSMRADDRDIRFDAPCLLIVPATTVHGFAWIAESRGTVITVSIRYAADLARYDEAVLRLFDRPGAYFLDEADAHRADRLAQDLVCELGWSLPGHRAAVDSSMLAMLVVALRNGETDLGSATRGHHAAVVARLRERIEQRFRLRESIGVHAAAMGLSQSALRAACLRVARMSPARMLDERALLEARRSLLYSNLSVSEIGYSLGFSDPAYFSRFFTRQTGLSPRAYRDAHRLSSA